MKTSNIKKQMVSLATLFTLGMTMLAGNSAFASQEVSPGVSRFAALFTLKTMVSSSAESTGRLEESVQENSEYYQSLRFFQLSEKSRAGRTNCANIQSTFMTSAIMLSTVIEANREALKQIPEINNDVTLAKLSKITEYLHEAKAAQDNCSIPSASLVHVKKARLLITEVNAYLEKIQNELPQ
ncbi:hypothetical protein [Bdellovibrio svalbardensis]|uniref:Uncharacterized protein n=1 Tax=Bdellovibrio svalbardensis TaxID=2972972 RepID=A0ABT6DGB2_9BACT|nr:hypothetical protein [Bdellovibrio svalbardensis]MDG0814906.1 hypothetical protein [Bdellovibrio svalbardensis]